MQHRPDRRWRAAATVLAICLSSAGTTPAQHTHGGHDQRALAEDPRLADGQLAPVLEGLGNLHHEVTTSSDRAQLFFDQGLRLTYGFNHQEALRAFKEAARLDPDCAMAYWGWALVLGPNINLPMQADVVPQAWEAIQTAMALRDKVSPRERAYIEAMARRLTDDPKADRAPLDAAYAEAMGALHRAYPEDDDAATLYAAALMNLAPWNYWTPDGSPRENTQEVIGVLEGVMERTPDHIGALHYYIHIIEPVDPQRGERVADALRGLAPGAGHLVHMPSHIYIQLGRFADSFDVNRAAVEADSGYITQCRAQGIYPLNYYPHNLHFLTWAAMQQGRSAEALAAAREVASKVPDDQHGNDWGLYETFLSMPLLVMTRFGMWDEALAEPEPRNDRWYHRGIWHYARGSAFAHTGRLKEGKKELAALRRISEDPDSAAIAIGFAGAARLLDIASHVLAGELAAARGRNDEAIGELDRAVRLEDLLTYTEPPDWYSPVRDVLGAVLLEAGRPEEAEAVYWQALKKSRDNGYALFGLWRSLEAQDRAGEAAEIRARFEAAWADADVQLTSSRF